MPTLRSRSPMVSDGRGGRASFRRLLGITLAMAAVGAACSDSSGPEVEGLSQAEASQLLVALSAAYLPTPALPSPTSAAPVSSAGMALVTETTVHTDETSFSFPCGAGGSVLVTTTDTTTITVDVVFDPTPDRSYASSSDYVGRAHVRTAYAGCGSFDGSGGTWTFDSESGLTLSYDLLGETDVVGFTSGDFTTSSIIDWMGSWEGSLNWSHDGRSGTCTVSVATESHTSIMDGSSTYSYSQTGSVCGVSVASSSSSPM